MSAAENKRLMEEVFAELAKGNGKPFRDAMADDFSWTIKGTTPWSRTYSGKEEVLSELMGPLFAQFAERYTNTAHNMIAEGDQVVVECRGRVKAKSGERYDNDYCYVCRLDGGKLRELTEYLDTELVARALAPPRAPV
jgi:ketosteroid isomerase-like protein